MTSICVQSIPNTNSEDFGVPFTSLTALSYFTLTASSAKLSFFKALGLQCLLAAASLYSLQQFQGLAVAALRSDT